MLGVSGLLAASLVYVESEVVGKRVGPIRTKTIALRDVPNVILAILAVDKGGFLWLGELV